MDIEAENKYIIRDNNNVIVKFNGFVKKIEIFDDFDKNLVMAQNKLKTMIVKYIFDNFEHQSKISLDNIEEGYGFKFNGYTKAYISSKIDISYKIKMLKDFTNIFVTDFIENELSKKYGVIYCVEDLDNDNKYVGKCTCYTKNTRVYNLIDRWNLHVTKAFGKTKGGSTLLHEAIKDKGYEKFKIYELVRCKPELIDMLEYIYINKLNTVHPNGYNLLSNKGHNQITKQKMSLAQKGIPKNYIKLDKNTYNDIILPPGIEYFTDGKGNFGYRARKISNEKSERRSFLSKNLTMEEKLELAVAYRAGTKNFAPNFTCGHNRTNEKSLGLPQYMKYCKSTTSEGYRVTFRPLLRTRSLESKAFYGTPIKKGKGFMEKTFTSKKFSLEEKHGQATQFLDECKQLYKQQTGYDIV